MKSRIGNLPSGWLKDQLQQHESAMNIHCENLFEYYIPYSHNAQCYEQSYI